MNLKKWIVPIAKLQPKKGIPLFLFSKDIQSVERLNITLFLKFNYRNKHGMFK